MSEENSMLKNGGRLLGETILTPGASLLFDGQVKSGLLHVGAGLIARFTLGLPGLIVVAANSYSKTVSGKSLMQNCFGGNEQLAAPVAETGDATVVESATDGKSKQLVKKEKQLPN